MLNDLPHFLSYKDAKLYKKVIKTTFLLIVSNKIEIISRKKSCKCQYKMLYKCYYRN